MKFREKETTPLSSHSNQLKLLRRYRQKERTTFGGICIDASYFLKKERYIIKIALIAHDKKKEEIINLAKKYKEVLAEYELYATGTTGTLIMGETSLPIHRMKSGPLGGDQQIGAMLANGELGLIIFLRDPLTAQPHEPDVSALLRLCDVQKIPLATNASSAKIMLESLKTGTFPTK